MKPYFFLMPKFVFDEQKNEKVLYWLCYKNVEESPFRVVSDSDKTFGSFVSEMLEKLKNVQTVSINSNNNIRNNTGNVTIGGKKIVSPSHVTVTKFKEIVIDTSVNKVEIKNNKLLIDDVPVTSEKNMFVIDRLVVKGNPTIVMTDNSPITVTGDVGTVNTQNGKVNIKGNVSGTIKVQNGNVAVSGTSGDCFVTNGSVKSDSIPKPRKVVSNMKILNVLVLLAIVSGCSEEKERSRFKADVSTSTEQEQTNEFISKEDDDVVCVVGNLKTASEKGDIVKVTNNVVTITDEKKTMTFINATCYIVESR